MSTRRNFPQRRTQASASRTTTTNQGSGGVDEEIVNLVEVKTQAENFYAKYQKLILGTLIGLIVIVGGYYAYKTFYLDQQEKDAVTAMYQAEQQFARDSFTAALNNPGPGFDGFAAIADNFSGTKAGNTAKLYAGLCNLNMGKYAEAVEYLEDYSAKDDITPAIKYGALGDATAELGDMEKALDYYQDAVNAADNEYTGATYLNKLGLLQFAQKKNAEALATFKSLLDKYPTTPEAQEAEKFITRLGGE
jgi:tetratricopeptide (TPR) repeat protein